MSLLIDDFDINIIEDSVIQWITFYTVPHQLCDQVILVSSDELWFISVGIKLKTPFLNNFLHKKIVFLLFFCQVA